MKTKHYFVAFLLLIFLIMVSCSYNSTKQIGTDVANNDVITIGAFSGTDFYDYLVSKVDYYNTLGKEQIEIIDFGRYDDDSSLTKLSTTITSGKIPDMLMLDSMPAAKYAEKGLFTDLSNFLDREVNGITLVKDELFEGPLKAMEYEGKLFWLSPEYYIDTYVGMTSVIGSGNGITTKELLNKWEAFKGANKQFTYYATNMSVLWMLLRGSLAENYIDYNKGTCSFENHEFINILELCATFPNEAQTTSSMSENKSPLTILKEGETCITDFKFNGLTSYMEMKTVLGKEDINFIGIPGTIPAEARCNLLLPLAISSRSANQEDCWNFICYMLSQESRLIGSAGWSLPLSVNIMDKYVLETMKYSHKWKQYEKDGNSEPLIETTTIDGIKTKTAPFYIEDYEELKHMINSATLSSLAASATECNIISEEAMEFFQGNGTADEAAAAIQSRVSIYLSENF